STTDTRHWVYVVEHALDDDAWTIYPIQTVGQRANRFLLDHGWKEAADRPAGPGLTAARETVSQRRLPDTDDVVFPRDDRDEGDVPYVDWVELPDAISIDNLAAQSEWWFTSPAEAIDGDFAVQQREQAMGPALPYGAI